MGLALPLLALPFLACTIAGLWWITRRLPAGWKGIGVGFLALLVIPTLAFLGWRSTLSNVTSAKYVCLTCGRTERQDKAFGLTCLHTLLADGQDYVQRFPKALPERHEHDWSLESCLWDATGTVSCTERAVEGWFRVLPTLKDREGADQVYREAQSLPEDQRYGFMQEVSDWIAVRDIDSEGPDSAFERWRARRRSR